MPKISIVMPIYNTETYLRQSIQSILDQGFEDFELILVNDCSTDRSRDIIDEYAKQDKRIVVLHLLTNMGAGAARNRGNAQAKGQYILNTDSDDFLQPDALATLYSTAILYESECVIGSLQIVSKANQTLKTFLMPEKYINTNLYEKPELALYIMGYHVLMLIKKDVLEHFGINYGENSATSEDGHFLFQLGFLLKKITLLPTIIYNYRIHSSSNSHSTHSLEWYLADMDAYKTLYDTAKKHNGYDIANRRFLYWLKDIYENDLRCLSKNFSRQEQEKFYKHLAELFLQYNIGSHLISLMKRTHDKYLFACLFVPFINALRNGNIKRCRLYADVLTPYLHTNQQRTAGFFALRGYCWIHITICKIISKCLTITRKILGETCIQK